MLIKADIIKFLKEFQRYLPQDQHHLAEDQRHRHQPIDPSVLESKLDILDLNGHTSFGKFFIAHDCTKSHLDLTIQSKTPADSTIAMTMNLAVNNNSNRVNLGVIEKIVGDCLTILQDDSWKGQFPSLNFNEELPVEDSSQDHNIREEKQQDSGERRNQQEATGNTNAVEQVKTPTGIY